MSPSEMFDHALRLEEDGEHERALAVWRQLAEIHPTRNVYLRLASITQDLGLLDDAESAFKGALAIDNRSALALKGLGVLAMDRRDNQAAVDYLKKACEIKESPDGLSLLGVSLNRIGNRAEAETIYRRAILIDPTYEEAYFNLGVLLRNDRPSEAIASFRTALQLDPNFACAHRELGYMLAKHGENPEAERHLARAIELEPGDAWTHIYLGTYRWLCGDLDAAAAEFRVANEIEPNWDVPLWSLGNIQEHAIGNLDAAQSYFEQALQVDPDSDIALENLCRLFKERGRPDLAREQLRRALLHNANNTRAIALLQDLGGVV